MRGAMPALIPGALLLLACGARTALGVDCRQGPVAETSYCGLPVRLANFQGYFACNNDVKVGRPADKAELLEMIQAFDRVKAVGIGHSWWAEQFCSGTGNNSINIVTTELSSTLDYIEDPVVGSGPLKPNGTGPIPIQVDEERGIATVQAGVPQRLMLNYLAAYVTPKAPQGYVLPAFAWYIDQTIGGAVATGTHGSTMQYGSTSSQVSRIQIALANGTVADFTPQSNPHLWRAAQVSVGRLGVITEVDVMIKPQPDYQRTVETISWDDYLAEMQGVQQQYRDALGPRANISVEQAVAPVNMQQLFWWVPTKQLWRITYKEVAPQSLPPPPGASTASAGRRLQQAASGMPMGAPAPAPVPVLGPSEGVFAQAPTPELGPLLGIAENPLSWQLLFQAWLTTYLPNGTFPARTAILSENEFANKQTSDQDPYDQYEMDVPFEQIGDCLAKVGAAVYNASNPLYDGFVIPPLLRFINSESPYLSTSNGGPRAYFNIEDHLSKSTGRENTKFQAVVRIFREECGARMHWGKAGWPRWAACFDGSKEYPDTWCHFGCAVQELDPTGKFRSTSDVWSWTAQRNGSTVPYAQCCTPQGFSAECQCGPRPPCSS